MFISPGQGGRATAGERLVAADSREYPTHLLPQVRAVAGFPLLLSGSPVGTLNVYRDQPTEWDSSDIQALRAYSDLIAEVVGAALAAHEHSVLAGQRASTLRPVSRMPEP
jgi:GAF domain-containing protein